jgi:pyruvate dehydrogenase E2 component (dihydrolipoyllysine-residue acetyltransferase)
MPLDVLMPRLSDQMEEGEIVRWLVEVGGEVKRGQELVEVDTDKATMAYEAEADGTLAAVLVPEGQAAAVGALIARLALPGEDPAEVAAAPGPEPGTAAAPPDPAPPGPPSVAARERAPARANASPVARRLATELGIDLATVRGTGPNGLISKEDVQAAADAADGAPPAAEPLSRLQRTIARRMIDAQAAPDFAIEVEADLTALAALRSGLASAGETAPSVNDYVVKAAALALREHPRMNASYSDEGFVLHEQVDVGVAVAVEDGLLVPVVRNADAKPLAEIAAETRSLAERVRAGTIGPPELEGATFTVTNLGMLGVHRFWPIIDPPQAAILAVGAARTLPRYAADGELGPRAIAAFTLVGDHRIVYGADAARFLGRVRELLEEPDAL